MVIYMLNELTIIFVVVAWLASMYKIAYSEFMTPKHLFPLFTQNRTDVKGLPCAMSLASNPISVKTETQANFMPILTNSKHLYTLPWCTQRIIKWINRGRPTNIPEVFEDLYGYLLKGFVDYKWTIGCVLFL